MLKLFTGKKWNIHNKEGLGRRTVRRAEKQEATPANLKLVRMRSLACEFWCRLAYQSLPDSIHSRLMGNAEKKKKKPANSDTSASWINVLPSREQAVEGTSSFTPYLGSSDLNVWGIWLRTERLTSLQIPERRRKSSDGLYHNSSLNVYSVWQFRKLIDVCNLIS